MRQYLRDLNPFLFIIAIVLVFIPVANHGLVWDDNIFLYDSPLYRQADFWLDALSQPFILSPNYYRPVVLLTYMIESQIFGVNPTIFHFTNLLLHLVNTALIAILARRLVRNDTEAQQKWIPVIAALVYGLHPALTEGVAFVSGRFDLLATTFLLLALVVDGLVQRPVRRSLAVAMLFLLALLSKESALVFLLVLPLWRLAVHASFQPSAGSLPRRVRDAGPLHTYLVVLIAAGLYILLRYLVLGYLWVPDATNVLETGDGLQHLLLVGRSVAEYLWLTIWPFTSLSPIHYAALPIARSSVVAWAALLVTLIVIAGLVRVIRSLPQSGWLVLAGFLSLLPVINIVPLQLAGGAIIAERYLLFPIALLTLALVPVGRQLFTTEPGAEYRWILPAIWLVLSIATIQLTLPHWQDDLTLWIWGSRKAPLSDVPPTTLAMVFVNQGNYERAVAEADRAVKLNPDNPDSWNNLGVAFFHLEDYENAQSALEEAVRLSPANESTWSNLAATLREQDQLSEALDMLLNKALPLNSASFPVHLNLALTYLYADRPDLAIPHLQEALYLAPPGAEEAVSPHLAYLEEPEPWLRLGNNLLANGAPEEALPAYDQAEALGAQPVDVTVGRSASLIELGRFSEAESMLQQALEIAPNDPRLYNNLGMLSEKQDDLDAAEDYFNQAIALAPDWEVPQQNLQRVQQ